MNVTQRIDTTSKKKRLIYILTKKRETIKSARLKKAYRRQINKKKLNH
jgi:hypothetical protein